MDSLRYYVVDFNKENQFWLCLQNQPTLHTNTQTSTRAIYHPQKFHHVVCLLLKEKGKELEVRNQANIPRGIVAPLLSGVFL